MYPIDFDLSVTAQKVVSLRRIELYKRLLQLLYDGAPLSVLAVYVIRMVKRHRLALQLHAQLLVLGLQLGLLISNNY